jgi:hypothetical protein
MNKTLEELQEIMANDTVAYVIDGSEAYVKLAKGQYNCFDTSDVEGMEELDIGGDKKRILWWLDLSIWDHLSGGILNGLTTEPLAKPGITMLWNPRKAVSHSVMDKAKLQSITLMGGRILSLETNMGISGASGGVQTLAKSIYTEFRGSYELSQADPRHIGTHRDQTLPPQHKHLVKPGGREWTPDDVETIYAMAMSLKLTTWDPIFGAKHKKAQDLRRK